VPWNKNSRVPQITGAKNVGWKGNSVSYSGLHKWLIRNIGRDDRCANCESKNNLDLANKTGIYSRDKQNWLTLCRPCHIQFDHADPKRPKMPGYRGNGW
jgi:hypothetical protein